MISSIKAGLSIFCLASFITVQAVAQNYEKEMAAFRSQDSSVMPPANAIVFAGSSSFTKWKDVGEYFPGKKIINRAFGGSTLKDLIYYVNDVVIKYQPKEVVIYCGENDIAGGSTSAETYRRFIELYDIIHSKLPKSRIVFVSMKASPSRRAYWGAITAANGMIRDFLSEKPGDAFVDVYYPMLEKGPQVQATYFLEDSLHMTPAGYKLWQKQIAPWLVKTK